MAQKMARYTMYGGELSLFTRKLEAALTFYDADFHQEPKSKANAQLLETRAGTHQIPLLQTPENWLLADTTPIIHLLDSRFGLRQLVPAGATGFLVHLLEEFFDEWVARVMVHYRWHYPDSAAFASQHMAQGDAQVAARVLTWGPRACRATGTDNPSQQRAAEAEYERVLAAAEQQLSTTPYLLGERPSALDCIVLGGLRAHTNMDPDPKAVVAGYPTVVRWAEQHADDVCRRSDTWQAWAQPNAVRLTPFADHVLTEMAATYQPFILANRAALAAGAKACHAQIYVTILSVRDKCCIFAIRR